MLNVLIQNNEKVYFYSAVRYFLVNVIHANVWLGHEKAGFFLHRAKGGEGESSPFLHGCLPPFKLCMLHIHLHNTAAHIYVRVSILTIFHSYSIMLRNMLMAAYISEV